MTLERLRIAVEGVVQGVGFRPFVFGLAARHEVHGFVTNHGGDVVIEAEAERARLHAFVDELRTRPPVAARVDRVVLQKTELRGESTFSIATSEPDADAIAAIAPDAATCAECVAELRDPASRRYRYAFTSCAACGPRLTIVTAAPYDRARTTMHGFAMCGACRAEHDDASDRRFHAQPIACPACGPRLRVPGCDGDAIELAVNTLARGGILAVKGLGGYHLACDATREDVVAELRRRKRRDAKPFAVMVANLARAAEIVELDAVTSELLASPARPIVLALARAGSPLAPSVAPRLADIGVFLPYTPLHHLLVDAFANPLVMTSGNISDEPIAFCDDDARARLASIADQFVVHDRAIHMRCDDSVARVVAGAPQIMRRARGYAPAPLRLPIPVDRPTLALGGHLKAAFALAAGDVAFVSPHFGDLDHPAAYEAFVSALAHFSALHRVSPQRVVCDRHPDYATTRLAEQLARDRGWELVAVQHHHAHFASALADAGLTEPAIGVVFDGAGYGDDGAIWGGEIFVGTAARVRRAFHLAYVPQPGGDSAAREPQRMAIAHLHAAGVSLRGDADHERIAALCGARTLAPPTSSVGRLFDAVAAMAGVAPSGQVAYEGQAAMELEALARCEPDRGAYPFAITDGKLVVASAIRAIASDVRAGVPAATIARRFHSTVVALVTAACDQLARAEHVTNVTLSGGVFQNAILADELPRRLAEVGLHAHVHRRVPPNDGGLSLGQLAVVAAGGGG
jgi:hydrogenase maturation protein HypF